MDEVFLQLSVEDRREVLGVAADRSQRPAHLLEKDVWVVWSLSALYGSPLGDHLVFKGGTSLSKAYKVIRRFSEDVDLTYDIRALAADLDRGGNASLTAQPTSRYPKHEVKRSGGRKRSVSVYRFGWRRQCSRCWRLRCKP